MSISFAFAVISIFLVSWSSFKLGDPSPRHISRAPKQAEQGSAQPRARSPVGAAG